MFYSLSLWIRRPTACIIYPYQYIYGTLLEYGFIFFLLDMIKSTDDQVPKQMVAGQTFFWQKGGRQFKPGRSQVIVLSMSLIYGELEGSGLLVRVGYFHH